MNTSNADTKELKKLISENKIEEVLSKLEMISANLEIENRIITVSSQFKEIKSKNLNGSLNVDNFYLYRNKCIESILSIIDDIDSMISDEVKSKKYKEILYNWIKKEFKHAKEIKLDLKVYPKIILDCYLKTHNDYSYAFITNKEYIRNLEEFVKQLFRVINCDHCRVNANNVFLVNFNEDEDVDYNYLKIIEQYDEIMDLNELDGFGVLDIKIENDKIVSMSDQIYEEYYEEE